MAKTGFCGSLLRCVLTIINVVFFIVGALIFAIAAILNWDKGFVINKIKENTNGIIDLNILSGLTVVLFILGSAIIIVSVIGLVGACCASKCFLIFYEIILAVLFVFHLIILIYFLVKEQEILDKINSNLNKEVIKAQNASSAAVEAVCKDLKYISKNFKCCGFNSSADFSPETLSYCCEQSEYDSPGCGKKVIDFIKKDAINILLISSAVFLSLELLFIIAVPFLIYKVSKSGGEKYESYQM